MSVDLLGNCVPRHVRGGGGRQDKLHVEGSLGKVRGEAAVARSCRIVCAAVALVGTE